MLIRSFTPEFVCEFDKNFALFPFDTQECYIDLMINDGTEAKFIELIGGTLTFNAPEDVNQYRFEANPSMKKTNGNSVKVLVKFKRLPYNRMLTFLLPTILINLVRHCPQTCSVPNLKSKNILK